MAGMILGITAGHTREKNEGGRSGRPGVADDRRGLQTNYE